MVQLEFLGFAAGFFSIVSFIPQIYKTYKLKSAEGVSIQMFIILVTAAILWTVYGFLIDKMALIVTNVLGFMFQVTQIVLKIKYDRANSATQKTPK